MKVLLITGSETRHKAFVQVMAQGDFSICAAIHEEGYSLQNQLVKTNTSYSSTMQEHLELRKKYELQVFDKYLKQTSQSLFPILKKKYLSLRGDDFSEIVDKIAPDLIAVYGTSIIKGKVIDKYKNKILNLHLGLSPYYRGSGTLYHPFANGQPYLAGSTFMYLDSGIDTGEIIHQLRVNLNAGKEFHEICFKHLEEAFTAYRRLIEKLETIQSTQEISVNFPNEPSYYFKDSDFTEESLERLKKQMKILQKEGDLKEYKHCESLFPIQEVNSIK